MLPAHDSHNDGLPTDYMRFAKAVKDALAGLHDPVRLEASSLASWLPMEHAAENDVLVALRKLLRAAIECLKPEPSIPFGRSEWLGYRLLWLRYVQSRSRHIICDELGLSQNTFYRIHREALGAVVHTLWGRHVAASHGAAEAPVEPQMPTPGLGTGASDLAFRSKQQMVRLGDVLESAAQIVLPLVEAQNARLCVQAPRSLPRIRGDPAIIRQIILNVLAEAVQLLSGDVLRLSVVEDGGRIVYAVGALDASRINSESLSSIPGIQVSQSLLAAYGGSCWLSQGEGGEAVISFSLPVRQPPLVLIVDDDTDTLELYGRYLRGEDYSVAVATSAQAMRDTLSEMTPHVILLDVLMPLEDGWDILRYLKETPKTAAIPVVVCSVLSQPQLALAMGATRVLEKPIQHGVLLEALRQALAPADTAA